MLDCKGAFVHEACQVERFPAYYHGVRDGLTRLHPGGSFSVSQLRARFLVGQNQCLQQVVLNLVLHAPSTRPIPFREHCRHPQSMHTVCCILSSLLEPTSTLSKTSSFRRESTSGFGPAVDAVLLVPKTVLQTVFRQRYLGIAYGPRRAKQKTATSGAYRGFP
eukprot:856446-Rhodomonas_salina.5